MSDWIKCSDRLPEAGTYKEPRVLDDGRVLECEYIHTFVVTYISSAGNRRVIECYFCNGKTDNIPYCDEYGGENPDIPVWYTTYMNYEDEEAQILENVIAWMPKVLPEPFEG